VELGELVGVKVGSSSTKLGAILGITVSLGAWLGTSVESEDRLGTILGAVLGFTDSLRAWLGT